jgi:hypothetical protein
VTSATEYRRKFLQTTATPSEALNPSVRPKTMFDPSNPYPTDPFARYHAAVLVSEKRIARAQAESQATAQKQQRIQAAAAKRTAWARPEPGYKPDFSWRPFV